MKVRRPLVLAYHRIASGGGAMRVSPEAFTAQMELLLRWGLTAADLGERAPGRFTVTFDDGYRDAYSAAFPVLERLGISAVFYVCPSYIGAAAPPRAEVRLAEVAPFLDWPQVVELDRAGHTIGSHTLSHRELPQLTDDELDDELVGSRVALEDRLGHEVVDFCYPRGKQDQRVRAAVVRAGYQRAVITPSGRPPPEDQFTIERAGIYGHDTPLRFRAKVLGVWRAARRLSRR